MTVTPIAVLDADVLYPMILRDTLLRVAAAGGFRVHWSAKILDEVVRNLIGQHRMDASNAASLVRAMEAAFPDAMVEGWEALEAKMPNHPKDRHVAAAAKRSGAGIVVTSNLKDFSAMPDGIVAMSPDAFLTQLLDDTPYLVLAALHKQAAGYRKPATTALDLVDWLAKVVPDFSFGVKALLPAA
jgi:predicted nucleic acid-binding protein